MLIRLLHIFITGDIQLEDFQITGALSRQPLGTGSLWKQTPRKDHKAFVVQTLSQLVFEAAVTACYQHGIALTILHVAAAAMLEKQLGEDKREGRDGDNANDLAKEKNHVFADAASVKCLLVLHLHNISLCTTLQQFTERTAGFA